MNFSELKGSFAAQHEHFQRSRGGGRRSRVEAAEIEGGFKIHCNICRTADRPTSQQSQFNYPFILTKGAFTVPATLTPFPLLHLIVSHHRIIIRLPAVVVVDTPLLRQKHLINPLILS